jgi:hypothetical protein
MHKNVTSQETPYSQPTRKSLPITTSTAVTRNGIILQSHNSEVPTNTSVSVIQHHRKLGSFFLIGDLPKMVGRNSLAGIVTRYGMDDAVGERFAAPVQTAPAPSPPASYTMSIESLSTG